MKERDAKLFELRFNPPHDPDELFAWLVIVQHTDYISKSPRERAMIGSAV